MDKNSALYQLMEVRMDGIMDKIVEEDALYQETNKRSDECYNKLDSMHLSKELWRLIDNYVNEKVALGTRFGELAYMLGFSDCVELMTKPFHFPVEQNN